PCSTRWRRRQPAPCPAGDFPRRRTLKLGLLIVGRTRVRGRTAPGLQRFATLTAFTPPDEPALHLGEECQLRRRDDQRQDGRKSQTEYDGGRQLNPPLGGRRADGDLAG